MLKHYAEIWVAGGFVAESYHKLCLSRDPNTLLPFLQPFEFSFRFLDRVEMVYENREMKGEWENPSPTYIIGKYLDEAALVAIGDEVKIALANLRTNRHAYHGVVRTVHGYVPCRTGDIVIKPGS